MIRIVGEVLSPCEKLGYNDRLTVSSDAAETVLSYRAWPNPYRVLPPAPYTKAYGVVAPGEYPWECILHTKYKKCLLIANGGPIRSRIANVNHDWSFVIAQVFFHCGQTSFWAGSAGCQTLAPQAWARFIDLFTIGDKGTYVLKDNRQCNTPSSTSSPRPALQGA